jgi:hypothetical protein
VDAAVKKYFVESVMSEVQQMVYPLESRARKKRAWRNIRASYILPDMLQYLDATFSRLLIPFDTFLSF